MSSAPGPRSGDSRPRLVVATAVLLSMGALTGIYATWTGYHAYMAAREDRVVTRVVTAAQTAVVALDAEANAARAQGGAPPGAAAETDASFAEVADAAGAVPPLTPSEPRGPAIALLDDPMGSLERARSADPDASAPATEAGASYASLTHGAATVSAAYAELLLDPSLAAYVTGFLGPPTTDMAASAVLVDFASEFVNDATSAAQSIFSAALARLIVTLGATLLAAGGLLFAVRHWLRHRRQAASRAP
ncbi:MAG: hypothetical protein LBK59_06835, partial [Bifidobacteriaceae bacterium]|nr:hypothetical protein [Bifidobacteriaceae bacterium]